MNNQSLVIVMPISRKHIYVNFGFEDFVNQPVLFSNGTTPLTSTVTLQLFWMARTCLRMLHQLVEQFHRFLMCCRLATTQLGQVFFCLRRKNKFVHSQRELSQAFISSGFVKRLPFPCLISSRASSTLAKNSSFVINVGSACFSATSLRRYLAARFSRFSSSAIMLILRSSSAFICIAVISNIFFRCKNTNNN